MVPMGNWAQKRLKSLGKNDVVRFDSQVGSGFGKNIANWIGRKKAYPTNVLHLATETSNRKHSATFPKSLPEFFIKLFTREYEWVLDPFLGIGTTCEVSHELIRNSVGIEIIPEYIKIARKNVPEVELMIFEKKGRYG